MMEFHFLRPWWFLALLPLLLLAWQYGYGKTGNRDWSKVVDARLLPYLLIGNQSKRRLWPLLFWLFLGALAVIAMAGPVWKKLPQPVFKQQSALVILLDLSNSMNVQDIKPSRIARARLKLIDLLNQRNEGQTALIAYAATAYTVTPLTDDVDTIKSLVSSLQPEIMPAQGSRADRAIEKALELFANAGVHQGDILLITDGVSAAGQARIDALDLSGFRLSVLSVGSADGGPIPLAGGGFAKDAKGSIVIAKTDQNRLRQIAASHAGIFSPLTLDDSDINRLKDMIAATRWQGKQKKVDFNSDRWQEEGPWLLLLVTPLVALAFRKGFLMTLLLAFILFPQSRPAEAFELGNWQHWFKNSQQQAQDLLQQGKAKDAAQLFKQPEWKGAALYKAEDFEQAAQQLAQSKSLEAQYNRANALARLGQLEEALKAYDEVLKKNPQHEDAAYNRKLVEEALKKQQQQQNKDQKSQDQQGKRDKEQDKKDEQQNDQQNKSKQDQQSKDAEDQKKQQREDEKEIDKQARQDQQKEDQKKQEQKKKQQKQAEKKEDQKKEKDKPQQQAQQMPPSEQDLKQRLDKQAEEQWLRRIPDDPGGLLRNKFRYQYSRQQPPLQEKEPW